MKMQKLDPHPFSRGGSWAIVTISAMHVYQSAMLQFNPAALHATDLAALVMAFRYIHLMDGILFLQVIMVLSSGAALCGAFYRLGYVRLIIFMPQHLLLAAMAWGGIVAAIHGSYLDGTPMAWAHISADQIGYMALFSIHSSAIVRRCRDPNG
jgi:hypothetical protein